MRVAEPPNRRFDRMFYQKISCEFSRRGQDYWGTQFLGRPAPARPPILYYFLLIRISPLAPS